MKLENRNSKKSIYIVLIIGLLILFVADMLWVTSGRSEDFDLGVMNFVYENRIAPLNTFMEMITYLGDWFSIVAVCLLLLAFDSTRLKYGVPVAAMAIISSVINKIFKTIIQRERPLEEMMLIEQDGFSFPSGHSITALAVYGILAYIVFKHMNSDKAKKGQNKNLYAAGLVLLALIIGISRVYLGVHYPTDILGGFTEAAILILIFVGFALPKWNKLREKIEVKIAEKREREKEIKNLEE